jgi:hypothetical protein
MVEFVCFWPTRVGSGPFALARFERDCEKGDAVILPHLFRFRMDNSLLFFK